MSSTEENFVKDIKYSAEEIKYRSKILTKIRDAYTQREQPQDYFDGRNYTQYWQDNEKRGSAFIPPRKNRDDVLITAGTARQKMKSIATSVNNLNLTADISAYTSDNILIPQLGEAMEVALRKTEEIENDEEKKILRTWELLKQGDVFVEDVCVKASEVRKNLDVEFNGRINSAKWTERIIKLAPKAERNILHPLNVLLGDITIFDIQNQPFIVSVKTMPYSTAESLYGSWERFKYVTKDRKFFAPEFQNALVNFNRNFALTSLLKDQVEELKYMDRFGNEYMIFLNGVMMLPVGFPLPYQYGLYNIEHQVNEPFSPYFAYGRSLPANERTLDDVYDEMLRLMVLKTQNSLVPAISNMTGKVLSSRMFMPGKINNGVDANQIKPMLPAQNGVNNPEFAMFKEIKQLIDNNTINPQFQGQDSLQSGQTATEVLNRQRQAEVMLGNAIFASSMLEKKLAYLRIGNIMTNFMDPYDEVVDSMTNTLKNKYYLFSNTMPIEGKGVGEKMTVLTDGVIPPAEQIKAEEDEMEESNGVPVKKIYVNAPLVKKMFENMKLLFKVTVLPRPKKSSELDQIMFRNELVDLQFFGPELNRDYLKQKAATVWNEDPKKLFVQGQETPILPGGATGGPDGNMVNGISKMIGMQNAAGGVKTPSVTGGQ